MKSYMYEKQNRPKFVTSRRERIRVVIDVSHINVYIFLTGIKGFGFHY